MKLLIFLTFTTSVACWAQIEVPSANVRGTLAPAGSGVVRANDRVEFRATAAAGVVTIAAGRATCGNYAPSSEIALSTINFTSVSSGSGTHIVYLASDCTLKALTDDALSPAPSCTGDLGCTAVPTASVVYPAGSMPIASIATTTSTVDSVTDVRPAFVTTPILAGTGILAPQSGGITTVGIDTAVVPRLGSANTYTEDNNFTAGKLGIPRGSSNPGTCYVGEIYDNSSDGLTYKCTATNTWTAIGGATYPDLTGVTLVDEFCGGGTAVDATYAPIGELGWRATVAGVTEVTSTVSNPCIKALPSTTGGGNSLLWTGPAAASTGGLPDLAAIANWEINFVFRKSAAAETIFFVGLAGSGLTIGDSNVVGLKWASADSDGANIEFRVRDNGGSATDTDAGLANSNTSWHRLRIRRVAGTADWCLDACSSPTTFTFPDGNAGDAQWNVGFRGAHSSSAYNIEIDYFSFRIPPSTLTRY